MLDNTIRQYVVFHHIECFFKELFSCVEIVLPVLAIAPDVTQIYGSRSSKTKGCFVVIVVVEMTVLGRTGKTFYSALANSFNSKKTCHLKKES